MMLGICSVVLDRLLLEVCMGVCLFLSLIFFLCGVFWIGLEDFGKVVVYVFSVSDIEYDYLFFVCVYFVDASVVADSHSIIFCGL